MSDKVTLINCRVGNVQPVKKVGENNVLNFSVAVPRYVGKGKDKATIWYQCAWWGADNAFPYIEKGNLISHIEGQLAIEPHAYLDKDGNPKAGYNLTVLNLEFAPSSANSGQKEETVDTTDYSNDIPF